MTKQLFVNGNLKVAAAKLTYRDTGTKKLFALPKSAHLLKIVVVVEEAFNDSGTDLLDIGVVGTTAKFVNDQSLATAGVIDATLLDYGPLAGAGPQIDIVSTYAAQNSNASAGVAYVYALYAAPFLS